jgi:DNA-binding IclR family transcriptional regulator
VELASRVQPRLQEVAGPLLQALADELTATAALTVRDGEDAAVVLDVRSPRHADLHITYRPGLRHPVAIAASGIAILAGGPPRPSERAEVAVARERGWAKSTGELLPGASGVAAPVPAASAGHANAAVSAVWIGDRDDAAMARAVIASARGLSDAL